MSSNAVERWKKVSYKQLNAKQQENFNFHKLASVLADYGFNCLRLSDDWHGADLIACHINGNTFLKVQLKGRLVIDNIYYGKDIHIAFRSGDTWYLYPHDQVRDDLLKLGKTATSKSWVNSQHYEWPSLSKVHKEYFLRYLI